MNTKLEKTLKDVDTIRLMQRRFELITLARYRDKSRMKKAIEVQDELREKSKGSKLDSTKELRKWRKGILVHLQTAKKEGIWFLSSEESLIEKYKQYYEKVLSYEDLRKMFSD